MAGHWANFFRNNSDLGNLPSIFQVVAQENLSSILQPTLHHIFKVLAEKKPEVFQKYYQYSEETCCFVHVLLEAYFLTKYGASFSENFYSLKRISTHSSKSSNKVHSKLSRSVVCKSLFFLVIFQYLKKKLDRFHQQEVDKLKAKQNKSTLLLRAALGIYPYVQTAWEASIFFFYLSYAFGFSHFHSPLLFLSGARLGHLEPGDVRSDFLPSWKLLMKNGWNSQNRKLILAKSLSSLESLLASSFSLGMFFVQFLDWWYQADRPDYSFNSLPDPDYPKDVLSSNLDDIDPLALLLCPLCKKPRTNDTVTSVSGFAFCYPCISEYVTKNSSCPVTGFPCESKHLVKLYPAI